MTRDEIFAGLKTDNTKITVGTFFRLYATGDMELLVGLLGPMGALERKVDALTKELAAIREACREATGNDSNDVAQTIRNQTVQIKFLIAELEAARRQNADGRK